MEQIKKMNDFNHKSKFESDECSIKGICSLSPVVAAMKSVIFAFLQELAFYISKITAYGGKNEQIKNNFIETFSILISNSEYSQESLNTIINTIFDTLTQIKELYHQLCKQNDSPIKYYKSQVKLPKDFTIADVVKQGHKYSQKIMQSFNQEQKTGFDVLLSVLKSICLYMIELQNLDVNIDDYYIKMLSAIEIYSFDGITHEQIVEHIKTFAKIDHELMLRLFEARQEKYGKFIQTDVLISHKEGKAILVAGTDMREMELLLEATKDKGIDIYTHGQMITAHTLPKLKAYPHLVGHYGKGLEAYITDFSSFPGAVFLTKLSLFRVETLYSGAIYTTDKIVPTGISRIKDYDFEPLVKSALFAEGFEESGNPEIIKVGISEGQNIQKMMDLIEKINNNELKNIITIGVSNNSFSQKEYFERFLDLPKNDSFIISLSYKKEKNNVLAFYADYSFPLLHKLLNNLLPLKEAHNLKINCLYTRCEPHTLPSLINLSTLGVHKVYFGECPPNLFNPAIVDYIMDKFGISRYTTPEADYKSMTQD